MLENVLCKSFPLSSKNLEIASSGEVALCREAEGGDCRGMEATRAEEEEEDEVGRKGGGERAEELCKLSNESKSRSFELSFFCTSLLPEADSSNSCFLSPLSFLFFSPSSTYSLMRRVDVFVSWESSRSKSSIIDSACCCLSSSSFMLRYEQ